MSYSEVSRQPKYPSNVTFSPAFKRSLIGHCILILIIILSNLIFPTQPIPYHPTLRVDLVALPDVLKKDLTLPNQAPKITSELSKILKEAEHNAQKIHAGPAENPVHSSASEKLDSPEEMGVKAASQKKKAPPTHFNKSSPENEGTHSNSLTKQAISSRNKRALDRIKSFAKIQGIDDQTHHSNLTNLKLIKGNQISPGTSLSGEAKEALEASYFEVVRDRLHDNFVLPTWIARQDLGAQVRIFFDSNGKLKKFTFVKFSGNSQFDDAVKQALQESQPFPPPPEALQPSLASHGILVGFPL